MRGLLFSMLRLAKRLIGGRYGRGYASLPIIGALFQWTYRRAKPTGIGLVRYHGIEMYANADDETHAPLFIGAEYNDPEMELVQRSLKPGMRAIDVGANIGCFAVVMACCVGSDGEVWAFEPEPRNAGLLKKTVARNQFQRLHVEEAAVGDSVGTATLSLSSKAGGFHTLAHIDNAREEIEARVTSLDAYFQNEPPEIHFIKMDAQGAEPSVLRGMVKTLAASPKLTMIVELDPPYLATFGENPMVFLTDLVDLGFALYHISHERASTNRLRSVTPDEALAVCEAEGRHINLYCERKL